MDAASFICVMDELRPLDPASYNPFYEVWTRIERIPPHARHRLLDELEPGSLRNLWKASMARYVLDEARSLELFSDASVWDDFPTQPGQVFTYSGRCERYELSGPDAVRFTAAGGPTGAADQGTPATPWLRPTPGSFELPVTRFTQSFFVPPSLDASRPPSSVPVSSSATFTSGLQGSRGWQDGAEAGLEPAERAAAAQVDAQANAAAVAALSGCFAHASAGVGEDVEDEEASASGRLRDGEEGQEEMDEEERPVYSRVILPLAGPLDRWWEPIYCRLKVGLTLTPLPRDAGADLLLLYPSDPDCTPATADPDDPGNYGAGNGKPTAAGGSMSVSLAAAATTPGAGFPGSEAEPWGLWDREGLPHGSLWWPTPDPTAYAASPFSGSGRDYLRVAGPGVYAGCGYRPAPEGSGEKYRDEDCVFFVIVRRL